MTDSVRRSPPSSSHILMQGVGYRSTGGPAKPPVIGRGRQRARYPSCRRHAHLTYPSRVAFVHVARSGRRLYELAKLEWGIDIAVHLRDFLSPSVEPARLTCDPALSSPIFRPFESTRRG